MNISLIISGNLTGFSRFFALDADNKMSNAKFDFDFRNQLSFLENEQTAYVISFAPEVIGISIVNRILDSYRRSGILVSSVLLPRNTLIVSSGDPQGEQSVYRLLHAVQQRFIDKHLKDGMLESNISLLTQNDYMDLLRPYELRGEHLQKPVNTGGMIAAKGYVLTDEAHVSLYLSAPCRKKYEGYGSVFIVPDTVTAISPRINEPAVEVKDYAVFFNGKKKQEISSLDEKMSFDERQAGYESLRGEYSYHEICQRIDDRLSAELKDYRIDITYIPRMEIRRIRLSFQDKAGKPIPAEQIMPYVNVLFDGRISESCTCYGDQISVRGMDIDKKITIVPRQGSKFGFLNNKIEINGENVFTVETQFTVKLDFRSCPKEKRVTLENRKGREKKTQSVKELLEVTLTGNPEDWIVSVTSEYYDTFAKVPLISLESPVQLKEKKETGILFKIYGIAGSRRASLSIEGKSYTLQDSSKGEIQVKLFTKGPKYTVWCKGYQTFKGKVTAGELKKGEIIVFLKKDIITMVIEKMKYALLVLLFLAIGGGLFYYFFIKEEKKDSFVKVDKPIHLKLVDKDGKDVKDLLEDTTLRLQLLLNNDTVNEEYIEERYIRMTFDSLKIVILKNSFMNGFFYQREFTKKDTGIYDKEKNCFWTVDSISSVDIIAQTYIEILKVQPEDHAIEYINKWYKKNNESNNKYVKELREELEKIQQSSQPKAQSPATELNKANSSEKPNSDYEKLGNPATEWATIGVIQQASQNKNNSKLQARAKKLLTLHKAIERKQKLTADRTLGILSASQQEVVKAINKILEAKGSGWSFYCSGDCKDARSLQEVLDRLNSDNK